jgi:hypothetical protein
MERRERFAQRESVARVLEDRDTGAVLRRADGEVIVFDELDAKRRSGDVRAIVMPDGETQEFETARFRRR